MTSRLSRVLLASATLLAAQGLTLPLSEACTPPVPGIFGRDVFPAPGSTAVPTNVRVVVSYFAGTGHGYGIPADAGDPGIGTDLELRRTGGAAVAVTRNNITTATITLRQQQVSVVLTPSSPLAPGVEYEVVDRRPSIPCGQSGEAACALGAITVVGTFTTGTSPDAEPPPAPGGGVLTAGTIGRCESLGSCCGAWVVRYHDVRWSDPAGGAFLYNFYVGDSNEAQIRLLRGNQLTLALGCSGFGDPGGLWVMPGTLRVRAVDWAGHEGPALELGTIPASACANATAPDAGPDVSPDVAADSASDTAGPDVVPDGGVDAPVSAPDPVARDAAIRDSATKDTGRAPDRSPGGCQLGGPPATATLPVLLLLAAVHLLRRRR
jgi:uncharacterized protein (TIGR03382 family)